MFLEMVNVEMLNTAYLDLGSCMYHHRNIERM